MSHERTEEDPAPSGLPDDAHEPEPLGAPDPDPDDDDAPAKGPGAMPGIPTEGEPPDAG
jgi:hypothetical protein